LLLVGVDIGGTKTHIRWRRDGVAADHVLPTTDWRKDGNVADARELLALVARVTGGNTPSAIGIGAHGCDTAEDCAAMEATLQTLGPSAVRVVNDAELMPAAAGLERGIGLVVGTGSIAVARLADGTMRVAGGWGWILGDEGSAPSLVREAAKAIRSSIDLGQPLDGLYAALCRSLDVPSFTHFGRRLERLGNARELGRHAGAVFAAAEAGSALAEHVIRQGALGLVNLVERLVERGASPDDVVAGGGVISAQPLLRRLLADQLALRLPDSRLTLWTAPPVAGAVEIARRLAVSLEANLRVVPGGAP
jgi:N-acetylglucosamine kinase-like BadF-type ATPase